MPRVSRAGTSMGRYRLKKMRSSPAPSSLPASAYSLLTGMKNWRMKKMPYTPTDPGKRTPSQVPISPVPPCPSMSFPPKSGKERRSR